MKPGATTRPVASMRRPDVGRRFGSSAARIRSRSPSTTTLPGRPGAPVPSTIVPPRMTEVRAVAHAMDPIAEPWRARARRTPRAGPRASDALARRVARAGPASMTQSESQPEEPETASCECPRRGSHGVDRSLRRAMSSTRRERSRAIRPRSTPAGPTQALTQSATLGIVEIATMSRFPRRGRHGAGRRPDQSGRAVIRLDQPASRGARSPSRHQAGRRRTWRLVVPAIGPRFERGRVSGVDHRHASPAARPGPTAQARSDPGRGSIRTADGAVTLAATSPSAGTTVSSSALIAAASRSIGSGSRPGAGPSGYAAQDEGSTSAARPTRSPHWSSPAAAAGSPRVALRRPGPATHSQD